MFSNISTSKLRDLRLTSVLMRIFVVCDVTPRGLVNI